MFILTYENSALTKYKLVSDESPNDKIEINFCSETVSIPKSKLPESLSLIIEILSPNLKLDLTPITFEMSFDDVMTFDAIHQMFQDEDFRDKILKAKNLSINTLIDIYTSQPDFALRVIQLMV